MKQLSPIRLAVCAGFIATIIGLIVFTLSWNTWAIWGAPLPGYQIFLFPGNLMLVYLWHPLLTEEIDFWPKLFLLLIGQFIVVTLFITLLVTVTQAISHLRNKLTLLSKKEDN